MTRSLQKIGNSKGVMLTRAMLCDHDGDHPWFSRIQREPGRAVMVLADSHGAAAYDHRQLRTYTHGC